MSFSLDLIITLQNHSKTSFLDATEMKQIDNETSNDVFKMTLKDDDSEDVFKILRSKIGKYFLFSHVQYKS